MKYLDKTFTMPTCSKPMSDLEYKLRVGLITESEFNTLSTSGINREEGSLAKVKINNYST